MYIKNKIYITIYTEMALDNIVLQGVQEQIHQRAVQVGFLMCNNMLQV